MKKQNIMKRDEKGNRIVNLSLFESPLPLGLIHLLDHLRYTNPFGVSHFKIFLNLCNVCCRSSTFLSFFIRVNSSYVKKMLFKSPH